MIRTVQILLGIAILALSPLFLSGQLYFQLERAHVTDVKRYTIGDRVTYRTAEFGENWLSGEIERILPEDNALVFYDKITYLDEITHFKYKRPWPNAIGATMMRFGVGWLAFAGIIEGLRRLDAIDTQYEFGSDTAIIGVSTIATGFLVKKLWGVAVKKMNKQNRVRIVDVRF